MRCLDGECITILNNRSMNNELNTNVSLKTVELNFLQKLLQVYWVNPKRWLLDEFILEDGILTVKTKDGKMIKSSLSNITSKYSTDNYGRHEVRLKDENNNKLNFKEIPWMLSDEDWELVLAILSPEKSTTHKVVSVMRKILD